MKHTLIIAVLIAATSAYGETLVITNDAVGGEYLQRVEPTEPHPNNRRTQAAAAIMSCVQFVGMAPTGEMIIEEIECPTVPTAPGESPDEQYPDKVGDAVIDEGYPAKAE